MVHFDLAYNGAKVIATGVVLFWNFFVNRLWTFRDVDALAETPETEAVQAD
jgi:putative flippase GtrA